MYVPERHEYNRGFTQLSVTNSNDIITQQINIPQKSDSVELSLATAERPNTDELAFENRNVFAIYEDGALSYLQLRAQLVASPDMAVEATLDSDHGWTDFMNLIRTAPAEQIEEIKGYYDSMQLETDENFLFPLPRT